MATQTHSGRNENRTVLWFIAALIMIGILTYAVYAAYHREDSGLNNASYTSDTTVNGEGNDDSLISAPNGAGE